MIRWDTLPKVKPREEWPATLEFAQKGGGTWHRIYPPQAFERRRPVLHGHRPVDFSSTSQGTFPELGVVEIRDARIVGSAGWVLTGERTVLYEQSWTAQALSPLHLPRQKVLIRHLPGLSATLATEWAGINYAHFLLDSLGRLHLLEQAGFDIDHLDYLIFPKPPSENARALLDGLKIPEEKILYSDDGIIYEPDILLSPSFPGMPRNYAMWLPDFMKKRFGSQAQKTGRRLYLYRSSHYRRRLSNESAILRHLAALGFEIYDPVKEPDTARDFAEASWIISVHAASLAGLAFCSPGTRVLELIPTDHCHPYFYTLADSAELDYGCLAGPSEHQRPAGTKGPSPYDFTIDEGEFIEALNWLVSTSNSSPR